MYKIFFKLVVAVIIMFFAACGKEDNPEIESKGIASVKMRIEAVKPSEDIYGISNELASVKYKNGFLELNFPANVPDEYLGEYFWYNSENIIPEGVIISESQVKVGLIGLYAYNSTGNFIGGFYLDNAEWWSAEYIYADRNFSVKGKSKYGLVFDCSFKKGWNIRYYNPLERIYTTQPPKNVDFKWRYAENGIQ